MKNNYDQSSTGTNLDLRCFYDGDLASDTFADNFSVIQHGGYKATACYFFTNCGQVEKPDYLSNCYDFTGADYRAFRAFCLEQCVQSKAAGGYADCTARDVIEEKRQGFETWKEYAIELLDEMGIVEAMRDGFPDIEGAKVLFEVATARGYSQGDYAKILFKREDWMKDNPSHIFSQFIFQQEIYCRLDVDGKEYHLSEGLADSYEYEKEELIAYAKEQGLSEYVTGWLSENLPDCPNYY